MGSTPVETITNRLFGTPEFRRLKMIIQGQPHDADREVLVKQIRGMLTANLADFRFKTDAIKKS
jgi:hypothetical protein